MEKRNLRKEREGIVVSVDMDKTITVAIARLVKDPLYGKTIKKTKKIMAHDEKNECEVNDRVRVMESRPLSKRKRWRLINIVKKHS